VVKNAETQPYSMVAFLARSSQ